MKDAMVFMEINAIPNGTTFLYRNHEYIKLSNRPSNPLVNITAHDSVQNACFAVHVNTGEIHVFIAESVEIKERKDHANTNL